MSDSRVGTFLAPTSPQTITFDTGLGVTPTGLIVFTGPPDSVNTLHDGLDFGMGFCDSALNQIAGGGVDPWTNNMNDSGTHWYLTGNFAQTVGAADGKIVHIQRFNFNVDGAPTDIIVGAVTALHADGTVDINFTVATDAVRRTLGFMAFADIPTKVGRVTWNGAPVVTNVGFAPTAVCLYGWQSAAWEQALAVCIGVGASSSPGTLAAGVGGAIYASPHGSPAAFGNQLRPVGLPLIGAPVDNAAAGVGSQYSAYLRNRPVIRATGTIASGVGVISPGLPFGTVAGDLLIMFLETSNQAITVAGWTQAPSSPQSDPTQPTRLTVFYKIAVGGDATATSDSGDHQIGRILGIQKDTFDPANPFNASAGTTDPNVTATGTIPGATTTVDNCLIILAACGGSDPVINNTAFFSGWTTPGSSPAPVEQIDNSRTDGNGGAIGVATTFWPPAGAYPASTVTYAVAGRKGLISLAIAPKPADTTFTLVKLFTAPNDYPTPLPFGYMAIGTGEDSESLAEPQVITDLIIPSRVSVRHVLGGNGARSFFTGSEALVSVGWSLTDADGGSVALWAGGVERAQTAYGEWGCGIFNDRIRELAHPTLVVNDLRGGGISDGSGTAPYEYSMATLDVSDPDCIARTWNPDTFTYSIDDYGPTGDSLFFIDLVVLGPAGGGCPVRQLLQQIIRYR